jgi:long-chain acyl-CoA synthetase
MTTEGSLVIRGRKKEILVTSYGKNIHPAGIEARIRDIPGVAEVLLVADGRPWVSAVVWLKELSATAAQLASLDGEVRRVNNGLSRPERVKRWVVLAEPLSIENGELTGNLKIRRQVVAVTRAREIEALYATGPAAGAGAGIVHIGVDDRTDGTCAAA